MAGVEHVIEYHFVTAGSCAGGIVDEPALRLEAGDIIVLAQGDANVMSSGVRRGCACRPITRADTRPAP